MKLFYYTLLFLLFTNFLTAQSEFKAAKINNLANSFSSLDNYISKNIEKQVIPGGVFLIAQKGKVIYFKSFGIQDKKTSKPYKTSDIFRIASMTKAITVTAIMQLIEIDSIKLNDPVKKYIPSFNNTQVLHKFNENDSTYTTQKLESDLTIKNLLTHTSGIYYGDFEKGTLKAIYKKNNMLGLGLSKKGLSTEEMVDNIAHMPLAFQPGSAWKYGLNMEVLGRIVEVVSKQNLSTYFNKNIFLPLGMTDTYFYLPIEKQNRLVKMNFHDSIIKSQLENTMNYPKLPDHNHYAGGGGLSSTALDYAKFCMALANKGTLNGKRILKEETVGQLYQIQTSKLKKNKKGFSKIDGIGFGLGFGVIEKEKPLLWPFSQNTYFWSGVFNTKYWIDPKKELVFVGMTQVYGFNNQKFWNKLYKEIYDQLANVKETIPIE